MNAITYLAGPYSKGRPEARVARFHALTHAAAKLIEGKRIVYSPITMTHPIDQVLGNGETLGSDFWVAFDEAFIGFCSSIAVLMLPGWKDSSGVTREIGNFAERGVAPEFLAPGDLGITADNPLFAAAFDEELGHKT